jgi:tRNA(His) 5'-end guanylyltransferase
MDAHGLVPEQEQKRLNENFIKSKEKMQEIIWDKFGINYQAVPRAGIKLNLKK